LRATETEQHTLDALLQSTVAKTHSLDAIVVSRITKEYSLDAILQGTETKAYTLDAVLGLLGITASHTLDAFLVTAVSIGPEVTASLLRDPTITADPVPQPSIKARVGTPQIVRSK